MREVVNPDREALVGVYGAGWVPWVLDKGEGAGFIIYQAGRNKSSAQVERDVVAAVKHGITIYLDVGFYESKAQRSGLAKAPPLGDPDDYVPVFRRLLDRLQGVPLGGITIEEENVYWHGRARFLAAMYRKLKGLYPDRRFFQWYSSALKANVPGRNWPDLPADGWVIDQYRMDPAEYASFVDGLRRLGKPIVAVVWMSPTWRLGPAKRDLDPAWWDSQGRKRLLAQLAVNERYRIPTAFYMFGHAEKAGRRLTVPLWRMDDPCTKRFVGSVFARLVKRDAGALKDARTARFSLSAVVPTYCSGGDASIDDGGDDSPGGEGGTQN